MRFTWTLVRSVTNLIYLKQLSSFKEKVVPQTQDPDAFEDSAYFSGGEGVSSYTVEFSFSVAEEKSNTTMFSFSTSESWNDKRLQELRNFVKRIS